MDIIGRKREQDTILHCLQSERPEFLVVYGRRRVGKTYLIKEYFNNQFSFYATGVANIKTKEQLRIFGRELTAHGSKHAGSLANWFDAFDYLKELLESDNVKRDPVSGKRVVFLDELPWMDTARSDFKSALDYFWNSWGSTQSDLLLIVCGSATFWIINNIFGDKGGLYNRVTMHIHLMPFSLRECEELMAANNISMSRAQVIESYMVFGGIPYYINLFDRRLSLAQNIEELLFKETGALYHEYDQLFSSLFRHPQKHMAIINAMSKRKSGTTRTELAKEKDIGDGEPLTKALKELEECGFIRKYKNYAKKKQGYYFQIVDSFVLFYLQFLKDQKINSWTSYIHTPGYYAWAGNAFEMVCLNHIAQIKQALGISGVESMEYSWRSKMSDPGAQIDLLIDRKDSVINICEMKYTMDEYVIDADYEKQLRTKLAVFSRETSSRKSLHLTMITANGLRHNAYSGIVQNELTAEDLF